MRSTPVFCCGSPEVLEMWLRAGFKDMHLVNPYYDDMPLLHYAIAKKIRLSAFVLDCLRTQTGLRWKGLVPVEYGMPTPVR